MPPNPCSKRISADLTFVVKREIFFAGVKKHINLPPVTKLKKSDYEQS
jgi:hypothetical protein